MISYFKKTLKKSGGKKHRKEDMILFEAIIESSWIPQTKVGGEWKETAQLKFPWYVEKYKPILRISLVRTGDVQFP